MMRSVKKHGWRRVWHKSREMLFALTHSRALNSEKEKYKKKIRQMSIGFKSIDGRFLYAAERWALIVELLASNPSCFAYSSLLIRSIGSSMSIVYGKLANFFHLPVRHLRSNSTISCLTTMCVRERWWWESFCGKMIWNSFLYSFKLYFSFLLRLLADAFIWRLSLAQTNTRISRWHWKPSLKII